MKGIFRALKRIFRALTKRLRAGVAFGAHALDWCWASIFGGGAVEEEMEDAFIDQNDDRAESVADQLIERTPAPTFSPAHLVKRAVELRSGNVEFKDVFNMTDPEQKRLFAYVSALDESGMRAIRCMPIHTLAHHLDNSEFVASGLRPVDTTIRLSREKAEEARIAREAKAERKTGRRTPMADALTCGKALTLDELIASNRRRALA